MQEYELVIKGGSVITDSEIIKTELGISHGKIAAVGNDFQGKQTIDAMDYTCYRVELTHMCI